MFSSGLFGFCCSRHWDSAHFCAPASLKGTHVLHTQMCPYSPKPQWHRVACWREWALRGRSGGARTALAPKPVALKGPLRYSLCAERDSLLLAEMWGAPLPTQGSDSSPAPNSPAAPRTRGSRGLGRRERGKVWGCGVWVKPVLCQPCPQPCDICQSRCPRHSPSPHCSLWEALPVDSGSADAPCHFLRSPSP